jgi:hypothetical protein
MRCEIEMRVDELLPNSAAPFKAERASVSSLEELMELPWIKACWTTMVNSTAFLVGARMITGFSWQTYIAHGE